MSRSAQLFSGLFHSSYLVPTWDYHALVTNEQRHDSSMLKLTREKIKSRTMKLRIHFLDSSILMIMQPRTNSVPKGADSMIRIISTGLGKRDLVKDPQSLTLALEECRNRWNLNASTNGKVMSPHSPFKELPGDRTSTT